VIEATSGSYNRVLQMEYDLYQDMINQGYVLRRNVPLNGIENCVLNIEDLELSNFPNPFNPSTTIQFEATNLHELPRIEIYNLKGQKVNTLPVPESQSHQVSVVWDGTDQNNNPVASGIYFYRLKAGDVDVSKKCLLLK
jgi:hypothetical protein